MTWGWGLLLGLLAVLVLLLVVPVRVELHYKREGVDDRLHLGVRAMFGIVRLGLDIPILSLMARKGKIAVKKDPAKQMPKSQKGWVTLTIEQIEKGIRKLNDIRKKIGKYEKAIRRLTKTFHLEQLDWRTKFGTGDAAQTGWITGLGWAFKGIVNGQLYRYFRVESRPVYQVQPHFQAKGFRTELTCIIRFSLGKTMMAGLTLVILWWMEGIKCRSIRFKD
ncbi:DUF2953 domain-containing protein [Tumebacillus flagellatus]|uniref:DUF2953 domain-containing protein n=1 Tax=Tumebacillus flagellatus TaxID=1157490 RepID=A0A074LWB7_9BACL|nr:DUF2953 domain-containing protein [Tumebacillus flagellatus]KEO84363.1 hypothetical protein EL26_04460 [Tumebacillus flagellatus]